MTRYLINCLDKKAKIEKDIYGNFTEHLGRCIYDGLWVGKDSEVPNVNGVRKDVIEALKRIQLPVLRWPGGAFADTYHWKDGIGPQNKRKKIANVSWGGAIEDNSFGTHEFLDMCEEIGCDAFVNLNLGTGTVQEMVDWVEYMTGTGDTPMVNLRRENGREKPWKIAYLGVGNESWGGGGQMRAEHYVDLYKQCTQFIHIGNPGSFDESYLNRGTKLIAVGPPTGSEWTDAVMKNLTGTQYQLNFAFERNLTDGVSLHYYAFGSDDFMNSKTAGDFDEYDWYNLLQKGAEIEEKIVLQDNTMSRYDPSKVIGLVIDEWGSWYAAEPGTNPLFLYQQNTVRDAVLAAMTLNIFNKHADRVKLATIAQMVNVLQSIILTNGGKMILTPTYHVFDMYKKHQNATLLGTFIENEIIGVEDKRINRFYESSSIDSEGKVLATICNTSMDSDELLEIELYGAKILEAEADIIHAAPHAKNTTDKPDMVSKQRWNVNIENEKLIVSIPAASVISVYITTK